MGKYGLRVWEVCRWWELNISCTTYAVGVISSGDFYENDAERVHVALVGGVVLSHPPELRTLVDAETPLLLVILRLLHLVQVLPSERRQAVVYTPNTRITVLRVTCSRMYGHITIHSSHHTEHTHYSVLRVTCSRMYGHQYIHHTIPNTRITQCYV